MGDSAWMGRFLSDPCSPCNTANTMAHAMDSGTQLNRVHSLIRFIC